MLKFGEWMPDQVAFGNPGATAATNVVPSALGYRPLRALAHVSNALTARCQGAFGATDSAGNAHNYSGDETKLYLLDNVTWTDASGTTYATPAEGMWRFAQYGDLVIAVNGFDNPQKISMPMGTAFVDLGGSPPVARYAAVFREFLFLGALDGELNKIQWSGSGNCEQWTTGTLESDEKEFPEGGIVMGLAGGEVGYVFQERAITRAVRASAPISWQFDTVERSRGLYAPGSLQQAGPMIFYLSSDGFYQFDGQSSQGIGTEKVDRTFLDDLNQSYLARISSAIDPIEQLYLVAYPSVQSPTGSPDRMMIYNYALRRWSRAEINTQLLAPMLSQGYTLDSLATIYSSIEDIPLSLDSRVWQGGLQTVGAFDTDNQLAFLQGDTLEAIITTTEGQLIGGKRAFVSGVTPAIDVDSGTVALGYRERQSDPVEWTGEADIEVTGEAGAMASARYHRARVTIPSGAEWTRAQGVDFTAQPDGVA